MYAVRTGQFSVRDRGAATVAGEAPPQREPRPIADRCVGTVLIAGESWSVCVCEQQPTGLRDALAVGHETIGDLLAIGNEFRTHGQRVVHAGFAALLVTGGRLACEGREYKTK